MAKVKYSAFTTGATTANTLIVGYDSVAGTNNQYTLSQLKTGLAITTLYDGDGSLSAARTVTMGTYNLAFASTTAGQEVSFGQNVKMSGQGYTELHTGATPADPDWNNGNIQEMTLASSDQDFDPTNAKAGATYILKIKQPSSGAAGTINWNAASATVLWPSPGEPTLSTANNAIDIVTLICVVGGASGGTYYANATLNFS